MRSRYNRIEQKREKVTLLLERQRKLYLAAPPFMSQSEIERNKGNEGTLHSRDREVKYRERACIGGGQKGDEKPCYHCLGQS